MAMPFCGAAAAGLPQRTKILSWGENIGRTTGARILVDEVVAQTLSANQELVACDRVPMDYEHQSVKGHPNYVPDPRLSPGNGVIEVIPGDGVYLSAISYTANGSAHADSYTDVSAVVHLDADGRPLWISSVALTQRGDVAGMEFGEAVAALSARTAALSADSPKPKTVMQNDQTNPFRDKLIKLLGLTPGESGEISDEEIAKAIDDKLEAAGVAKPEEKTTEVALSARLENIERNALVDRATREGKVIPLSAEEIATTPVAVLSSIISRLTPGEVNLAGSAQAKEKPASKVVALSADEAAVARQLGLTEEQYRKANPKA